MTHLLAHLEGSEGETPTPGLLLMQSALAWLYHNTFQYRKQLEVAERALELARGSRMTPC